MSFFIITKCNYKVPERRECNLLSRKAVPCCWHERRLARPGPTPTNRYRRPVAWSGQAAHDKEPGGGGTANPWAERTTSAPGARTNINESETVPNTSIRPREMTPRLPARTAAGELIRCHARAARPSPPPAGQSRPCRQGFARCASCNTSRTFPHPVVSTEPTQEGGIDTARRRLLPIPNAVIRNRVPWQQDAVPAALNACLPTPSLNRCARTGAQRRARATGMQVAPGIPTVQCHRGRRPIPDPTQSSPARGRVHPVRRRRTSSGPLPRA